jgi:hypothetical protein
MVSRHPHGMLLHTHVLGFALGNSRVQLRGRNAYGEARVVSSGVPLER